MEESEATPRARTPKKPKRSSRPFGGTKRLYNVVSVRLASNLVRQDFNAQEFELTKGLEVIVETVKGPAIGVVSSEVNRRVLPSSGLKRVLRVVDQNDNRTDEHNQQREKEAGNYALDRIRARKLPMKLSSVEYLHDGSKAVFFFSAEGRIDFRDLVKDLASNFRTRIEMRQVGVRDGARMVGGIGTCGRELCCSTFLQGFAPVSIRMAKDQGLTLNPKKVSGMCGRLMCCLVYEQQTYRKAKANMPSVGKTVVTALGKGVVRSLDVVSDKVTVRLDAGPTEIFSRRAVLLEGQFEPAVVAQARIAPGDESPAPVKLSAPEDVLRKALETAVEGEEYLWGAPAAAPPPSEGDAPRARRRRRRGKGTQASGNNPGGDSPRTSGDNPRTGGDNPRTGGDNPRASDRPERDTRPKGNAPGSQTGEPAARSEAKPSEEVEPKPSRRRRARAAGPAGPAAGAPPGRSRRRGEGDKPNSAPQRASGPPPEQGQGPLAEPRPGAGGGDDGSAKPARRRRRRSRRPGAARDPQKPET
jgi:cell fate regulator YaaT (PSP1 superfamily)